MFFRLRLATSTASDRILLTNASGGMGERMTRIFDAAARWSRRPFAGTPHTDGHIKETA